MTIGQFQASVKGFKLRVERETEQRDQLNHMLGKYIALGVNNPKKYPSNPYLFKEEKTKLMSVDQFEELARKRYGKKK